MLERLRRTISIIGIRCTLVATVLFLSSVITALAQETCQQSKEQLQQKCCKGNTGSKGSTFKGVSTFAGQPSPPTERVNVTLCDGSVTQLQCIKKAVASGQIPSIESHKSTQHSAETPVAADQACAAAWVKTSSLCPAMEVPTKLAQCSRGAEVAGLPFCEDLLQLSGTQWCSSWNLDPCLRRHGIERPNQSRNISSSDPDIVLSLVEQRCLREWVLDEAKRKQKDLNPSFASNPELFPITFHAASPIPSGTTDSLQPLDVPIELASRPLPGFRLQMPGNFVRYYVEQVGLPAGFGSIAKTFKSENINASCDSNTLTCSINQVHLFDAKKFINDHRRLVTGAGFDIPQGLVNAKVERTEKGWDISRLDINVGPFQVHWWGTISLMSKKPLSFTLRGNETHLRLLPLHDPKDQNPPFEPAQLTGADQKARYLDRTWLIHNIPNTICTRLENLYYEDGKIKNGDDPKALNGQYITSVQPFKCKCPPPGSPPSIAGTNGSNYCIVDPWPREVMISDFRSGLPDENNLRDELDRIKATIGPLTDVFCDSTTKRILTDPTLDLGTVIKDTPYISLFDIVSNWTPSQRRNLWNDVATFGCLGRTIERRPAGPVSLSLSGGPFGGRVDQSKEISSAIGFSFDTNVDLGEMQVGISPSPITIDFPMEFKIAKWIEENIPVLGFLGVVIGWIVEAILVLISVSLTVIVSIQMAVFGPLITGGLLFGAVNLSPGIQNVEIQGIISHQVGAVRDTGTELQIRDDSLKVGVRRIVTTRPRVQSDVWQYHFEAPSCQRLAEGEGVDGFEHVVNFLKNSILCPLEAVGNLYQAITLPMRNLILWMVNGLIFNVQDAAEQAITANVIGSLGNAEIDSNLATLMSTSLEGVVDVPRFLLTDAATKAAIPAGIPPWLNWACQISPFPVTACNIAQLFGFNGELRTLERLGAMTHYRSLADYNVEKPREIFTDILSGFSSSESFYPPVRYCVGGDIPRSGLVDYRDEKPDSLLMKLSTLEEMHYTANPSAPATDWRNQCSAFIDNRVRFHTFTRIPNPLPASLGLDTLEVIAVPSVRSNFFLNEVFFCPTEESCNFGVTIKTLQTCLLAGNCDLESEFKKAFTATPFSKANPPMALRAQLAACSMASDIWYRIVPAGQSAATSVEKLTNLLSKRDEALDVLTSIIDRTCPINTDCATNRQSAVDFVNIWLTPCADLLTFYGVYDPAHTIKMSDIPASLQ